MFFYILPLGLHGNPSAGASGGYPFSGVQSTAGDGNVIFRSLIALLEPKDNVHQLMFLLKFPFLKITKAKLKI